MSVFEMPGVILWHQEVARDFWSEVGSENRSDDSGVEERKGRKDGSQNEVTLTS